MKVVILAGGYGTRISEETDRRPKPMVEIGGRPLLWHLMKLYAHHGLTEFIVCCGYRGYVIKEYFSNYFLHMSDVTFDLSTNQVSVHKEYSEPWKVTLVDTGEDTMTGGRLQRVASHLPEGEPFCLTYGDGLADIDLTAELAFHRSHGRPATVSAICPPGRYGALEMVEDEVTGFIEKPPGEGGFVNGGFFVLEPECLDLIDGDDMSWEAEPLQHLAESGQLRAFRHEGFWQSMDTLRDRNHLEQLWASGTAPWKVW